MWNFGQSLIGNLMHASRRKFHASWVDLICLHFMRCWNKYHGTITTTNRDIPRRLMTMFFRKTRLKYNDDSVHGVHNQNVTIKLPYISTFFEAKLVKVEAVSGCFVAMLWCVIFGLLLYFILCCRVLLCTSCISKSVGRESGTHDF